MPGNITDIFSLIPKGKEPTVDLIPEVEVAVENMFAIDLPSQEDEAVNLSEGVKPPMADDPPVLITEQQVLHFSPSIPKTPVEMVEESGAKTPENTAISSPKPEIETAVTVESVVEVDVAPRVHTPEVVAQPVRLEPQTQNPSPTINTTQVRQEPIDPKPKADSYAEHKPGNIDIIPTNSTRAPQPVESDTRPRRTEYIQPQPGKTVVIAEPSQVEPPKTPMVAVASQNAPDSPLMSIFEVQDTSPIHRPSVTTYQAAQPSVRAQITPQMIASQISASISGNSSDTIEIRLDPPELGRLIVSITQTDTGVMAHIAADKADIAEFLRRNSDTLARELEKAGFANSSLEFSHGENPQNNDEHNSEATAYKDAATTENTANSTDTHATYILHGELDIRL